MGPLFVAKLFFSVTVVPMAVGHLGALVLFSDPGFEHVSVVLSSMIAFSLLLPHFAVSFEC